MTAQQISEEIKAAPKPEYFPCFDANSMTRSAYRRHGSGELVVCSAGYWVIVQHYGATLVSLTPKAMSAGRGEIVLWPYGNKDGWVSDGYFIDQCGRSRLMKALDVVYLAWLAAGGNVDAFYRAMGASGHCAMCGATLTDELSMSRGIGPECYTHIYGGRQAVLDVRSALVASA
jgi:hypothetical protein